MGSSKNIESNTESVRHGGKISCSIFGCLQQWKMSQEHKGFAIVGLKFCQTLNKPLQNWPRLLKYYQSGEISPNLVTLHGIKN